MHKKIILVVVPVVIALASFTQALAKSPEEMGRELFNDPSFAGGQKACNDCHPNGRNLEQAGEKTSFTFMGVGNKGLEEMVNLYIVNAIKGKPIPVDSKEMRAMVSYIKSLGKK